MTSEAPRRSWHRPVAFLLRLIVAGVFIAAAIDKVIHPDQFADVLWEYELLPMETLNLFAVCFPWIELMASFCLIFGIWVPAATLLAAGMSGMFMGALGIKIAQGHVYLHCGCFTTAQEGQGTYLPDLLWRDGVLLIGILWLYWLTTTARPDRTSPPGGE